MRVFTVHINVDLTYDCYKVCLRRVELARRAGREGGTHDTTLAGEPVRWWEGSGRAGTPPCACWWRPPCPSCPRRPWTPAADPLARGTCSSWSLFGAERASTRSANYGTATQIYTLITTIYCLKNKQTNKTPTHSSGQTLPHSLVMKLTATFISKIFVFIHIFSRLVQFT